MKWEMSDAFAIFPEHHQQLIDIAAQVMNDSEVVIDHQRILVARVGSGRLRAVKMDDRRMRYCRYRTEPLQAQPDGDSSRRKAIKWCNSRISRPKNLAVVVDGEVFEYGKR